MVAGSIWKAPPSSSPKLVCNAVETRIGSNWPASYQNASALNRTGDWPKLGWMGHVGIVDAPQVTKRSNVADRLTNFAATMPDAVAVACSARASYRNQRVHRGTSGSTYAIISFADLETFVSEIARGLNA